MNILNEAPYKGRSPTSPAKKMRKVDSESAINRIPYYKKTTFQSTPVREDPYEVEVTPRRSLMRAKASTNLLRAVTTKGQTPDFHEASKQRVTGKAPISPHPGKDALNRNKNDIYDASSNSPLNRLRSSQSCANFAATTPVRTPVNNRLLSSGISLSALRGRKPVAVDWEKQITPKLPKYSSSTCLNNLAASTSKVMCPSSSPRLFKHRSNSVGSLSKTVKTEVMPPSHNLEDTTEKMESYNFERQRRRSNDGDSTHLMTLRGTPERIRYRETIGLRKSASNSYIDQMIASEQKFIPSFITRTPKKFNVTPVKLEQPEPTRTPEEIPVIDETKNEQKCTKTTEKHIEEVLKIPPKSILKSKSTKKSGRISFSNLQIFYFGREQAFEVVPKHGEVALGMEYLHFESKSVKVLKTKRPRIGLNDPEDSELSDDEVAGESCFVGCEKSPLERVRMLESAGVIVDKHKRNHIIRQSREQCGCTCRGGVCRPSSCECHQSGIKCQVDGPAANGNTYPCSCYNADLCGNEYGRDAYDLDRVTIVRRATLQRWNDNERMGSDISSPIVPGIEEIAEKETTFVLNSPDFPPLSGPRFPVTPIFPKSDVDKNDENNSLSRLFPPTTSLLS